MEPNDPYKAANGFSQPTVTPPPATSNEYEKFGEAGRILYELANQNSTLQEYKAKYETEVEEKEKYKRLYYGKCEECDEAKDENRQLKEENRLLKLQIDNGIPHSVHQYIYDVMCFDEKMKDGAIEKLMDICLELANTRLPREYLIEDSMDIIPVYILLAERNVFRKHGNSDNDTKNWGLAAFCQCWNDNVVARITDDKRRIALCCEYKKIEIALNKKLWSGAASCSWRSLYDSCSHKNGQSSQKKAKLGRAINIKSRLEKLLEQIPALKAKKY